MKTRRESGANLEDFLGQLQRLKRAGFLGQILEAMPSVMQGCTYGGPLEGQLKKAEAIILAMTPEERASPEIIGGSRGRRISNGSGTTPHDVNLLLDQFSQMQGLLRQMGSVTGPAKTARAKETAVQREPAVATQAGASSRDEPRDTEARPPAPAARTATPADETREAGKETMPAPAIEKAAADRSEDVTRLGPPSPRRAPAPAAVDVNQATVEQLKEALRGIETAFTDALVAGRPYRFRGRLLSASSTITRQVLSSLQDRITVSTERTRLPIRRRSPVTARLPRPEKAVNVDEASHEELTALADVDTAFAHAILQNGPYRSVDQVLSRASLIGQRAFNLLRDHITASRLDVQGRLDRSRR